MFVVVVVVYSVASLCRRLDVTSDKQKIPSKYLFLSLPCCCMQLNTASYVVVHDVRV